MAPRHPPSGSVKPTLEEHARPLTESPTRGNVKPAAASPQPTSGPPATAPRCVIAFDFRIGDTVTIVGLERTGTVTGLLHEASVDQYRVRWWHEGERKHEWLYSYEIRVMAEHDLEGR